MDPLLALFSALLGTSAAMFLWLTLTEGRRSASAEARPGSAAALDDLIGTRQPLLPHTIRQTPLD